MESRAVSGFVKRTQASVVFIVGLLMVGVSVYLTQHYFEVKMPRGFSTASICDISDFFNCDKATQSDLSNIFGVPISVFGLVTGLLVMGGALIQSIGYQRTLFAFLFVNTVGCIGLFLYSLIALGGLCPFCTAYYALSLIVFILYLREKQPRQIDVRYFAGFFVLFAIAGGASLAYADWRAGDIKHEELAEIAKQYDRLEVAEMPKEHSGFQLAAHPNAIIKMKVFSDFQCPGCRIFSERIEPLKAHFGDQLDIEYFFYPLDPSCNNQLKRPLHPFACQAAYIAACLPPEQFSAVHDELFANQESFSKEWLEKFAAQKGVAACANSSATRERVTKIIELSVPTHVTKTPTIVINGKKLEGAPALPALINLLDELVRRKL